jgi:hypothetical protein
VDSAPIYSVQTMRKKRAGVDLGDFIAERRQILAEDIAGDDRGGGR